MNGAHPPDFFIPKNREQHLSAHGTGTHCVDPNTIFPYSTAAVFVNPRTACLLAT
jgi:hypothetical protein